MKQVVYYDEYYASSWISREWSRKIVEYLEEKGIERKNAKELSDWLKNRLKERNSYESVLIFSQDMVPETIMSPLNSPNDLARRYLDDGGRMIWIGDHPFWNKGVRKEKDREEIWMHGAHYGMLGVEMLIAESSSLCKWVGKWTEKMKSRWYSQRPVNIEVDEERLNLQIEPLAYAEVVLLPSSWNAVVITRWKKTGRKVGSFGFTAPFGLGANVTLTEKFLKELSFKPLRLACAWHISFNKNYPNQGFYRLWDSGTTEEKPPESLLEDICTLASL